MKTLNETIKDLEKCMTDNAIESEGFYLAADSLFYLKEYRWIVENCADTLAEKYPSENVPLTWDELKHMEGKPVWIEYADDKEQTGWALIVKNPERPLFGKPKLFTFVREDGKFYLTISGYGKRWKAYRKEKNEDVG